MTIAPLPRVLSHAELLQLKRWNTPTIYNGWEQITSHDVGSVGFNSEETRDYMPQMGPMAGYAVTVVIEPSNPAHRKNQPNAWNEYRRYVASVPGPKIVVVQDLDKPRVQGSFWGEVNSNAHRALGCVGTIVDGAIRDVDEMTNAGFKALARRLCVGHGYVTPIRWGEAVEVFGCRILPGQLIHADKHGFLAVPQGDEPKLLEASRFMDTNECETMIAAARASAGQPLDEVLKSLEAAGASSPPTPKRNSAAAANGEPPQAPSGGRKSPDCPDYRSPSAHPLNLATAMAQSARARYIVVSQPQNTKTAHPARQTQEQDAMPPKDAHWLDEIHHGDCIAGLNKLPVGTVDLAFADPPFNIGYEYDVYDDKKQRHEYLDWSRAWIGAVHRVLSPAGTFWLAIGDEYAAELKLASQEIGFHCRSWVIWYYTFGVNCKNKFSRSHAHLFYFVKDPQQFTFRADELENRIPSARQLVYADARANPAGRLPDDTWVLRPQDLADCFTTAEDTWYFPRVAGTFKERAGFHGCQMPEQLLGRIVRLCSNPGDVVLDPFSGSATTVAVAKKLGRRYVAFDLSEDYVTRGRARLAGINPGDPLDGAAEPTMSAPSTANGKRRKPSAVSIQPINGKRPRKALPRAKS